MSLPDTRHETLTVIEAETAPNRSEPVGRVIHPPFG